MNQQDWKYAIDFPCSLGWRAYYAETLEGVYLPALEPYTKDEQANTKSERVVLDVSPFIAKSQRKELEQLARRQNALASEVQGIKAYLTSKKENHKQESKGVIPL